MIVAAIAPSLASAMTLSRLHGMRWPRKNDPASIRARQEILGVDGLVTSVDLEPFAAAAEALVGVAVIPRFARARSRIDLGTYELSDDGAVVETGRAEETSTSRSRIPRAA